MSKGSSQSGSAGTTAGAPGGRKGESSSGTPSPASTALILPKCVSGRPDSMREMSTWLRPVYEATSAWEAPTAARTRRTSEEKSSLARARRTAGSPQTRAGTRVRSHAAHNRPGLYLLSSVPHPEHSRLAATSLLNSADNERT